MQVIGVVDLLAGRAVHARAGKRESYQPVRTVAGVPIEPGDGVALARAYVDDFGVTCMYVADLDAILDQLRVASASSLSGVAPFEIRARLNPQTAIVRELVALGVPIWLDAGVASADEAGVVLELGVARVVVGLETLPSFEALEQICVTAGSDRVVFSLDLRDGSTSRKSQV